MNLEFNDAELEAYLDESLEAVRAAEVEMVVRDDPKLLKRLAQINRRRDAGMHTVGEIWRRHQIGVPTTEQMQDFCDRKLPAEQMDYIDFRMKQLKCPFTIALFEDTESKAAPDVPARRDKFYEKSAGFLRKKKGG